MRNKKALIILAIILVVLVVASVLLMNLDTHREKVRAEAGTLMQFKGSDITEVRWTYDGGEYEFILKDGKWINTEKESFPVNDKKIESLLASVQNFQTSFTIEKPDKLATYGLKNPTCTVTVVADKDYTISFGDVSSMDGLRYVSIDDGNVYLATDDVLDNFDVNIYTLMQFDGFPECHLVTEFIIEGENDFHIYYDKENHYGYSDEFLYYTKKGSTYLPLGTLNASNFIGYLTGYELVDYITFEIDDATLENYNLKNPELKLTAKYLPTEDSTETESITYYLSMAADNIAYIMKEGSTVIYRMDPKDFDYFNSASYDTLKAPDLALLNPADIDKMVVSMDGLNFTVRLDHDKDGKTTYNLNDEVIDLTSALSKLKATACKDFEDTHVGTKTIAIRLYGSNGNYDTRLVEVFNSTAEHSAVKIDGQYFGRTTRKDAVALVDEFVKVLEAEPKEE